MKKIVLATLAAAALTVSFASAADAGWRKHGWKQHHGWEQHQSWKHRKHQNYDVEYSNYNENCDTDSYDY